MADYVEGPRHYRITDQNQGARVLLASYVMITNTILSVSARAAIKLSTARRWSWDDTACTFATVFAIGHCFSMAKAYDAGMGQHMKSITDSRFDGFLKAIYASNPLYIGGIVLAKISVLLFIRRLTPSVPTLRICQCAFTLFTLWGLATTITWLFACGTKTWDFRHNHCMNLGAFTRATTAVDIITDLFLVALPIYIFSTMKYQKTGRWTVLVVFSLRGLIVIPSVFRMLSIKFAFGSGYTDVTWTCVPFEIWTVVSLHFSIISASIPCVRPFLRSLESGLLDSSMRKHPHLQSRDNEADKSVALTTMTGWSGKVMAENRRRGNENNSQKSMRRSILCNGEKPEPDQEEAPDEDQAFANKLRPEGWNTEHKTNIQSTRTFPQFSGSPAIEGNNGTHSTSSSSWGITMTMETNITFEEEGVNVQEIQARSSNNTCRGPR